MAETIYKRRDKSDKHQTKIKDLCWYYGMKQMEVGEKKQRKVYIPDSKQSISLWQRVATKIHLIYWYDCEMPSGMIILQKQNN